jgi:hypothetical protein
MIVRIIVKQTIGTLPTEEGRNEIESILERLQIDVLGFFLGFTLCRGKKCMFHRNKELIGCLRRNVEAEGNFGFAVFNRNNLPNFGQNFPNQIYRH